MTPTKARWNKFNNARPPISDAQSRPPPWPAHGRPEDRVQQPAHEGPHDRPWGMAGVRRRSSRNQQKREGKGKTSQHRTLSLRKVPSEWARERVTSLTPSGKVASTCTSWIILGDALHDLIARDDMRTGCHEVGDGASIPGTLDDQNRQSMQWLQE